MIFAFGSSRQLGGRHAVLIFFCIVNMPNVKQL